MTSVCKKRRFRPLPLLAVFLLLLCAIFFWYVSDYYRADETAAALLEEPFVEVRESCILLSPDNPTDTALIFYPGAKVEETAYLPLLEQLRQEGLACILVPMPFHMAIFDTDAALGIMEQFPEFTHWYVGGHSMGGAMASRFAADHPQLTEGVILLGSYPYGAYPYGDYPIENTLTVYGSLNTGVAEKVDYTESVTVIEGGNHAQFGNYGPQAGDPAATIPDTEQQAVAVSAIVDFIA